MASTLVVINKEFFLAELSYRNVRCHVEVIKPLYIIGTVYTMIKLPYRTGSGHTR